MAPLTSMQRVVDQEALRTPFGRVAAHQRRLEAVADHLQIGGDAAVGAEGARGTLPTVSWVMSAVVAFRALAAATVTSLSRLMPPSAKLASSAPSSLRTVTRAFWICRSPVELRSSGVSRKLVAVRLLTVRSAVGATPPLLLQGGDPAVDGAHLRLQAAHAAVDGSDLKAFSVEPPRAKQLQARVRER